MKAERWKQVNDLFQSAVERAAGTGLHFLTRLAKVTKACGRKWDLCSPLMSGQKIL